MTTEFRSSDLIFLISQPRAGSTLLQHILAGHPQVHTTAEPWLMLHPVYALRPGGHEAEYRARSAYKALQDYLGTLEGGRQHYIAALRQMGLHLYGVACTQAHKPRFLDKTPRYYYIIPELASIFPEASFIFLLRNPLAVLASILNTWVGGDWIRLSRHRDNLLLAPRLLVEGIQLLGDRALVARYEDLVREPADQVSALCERLGLAFEPELLKYGGRPSPVGRYGDPSGVQQHTHPTAASLDRWLVLGQWNQTRQFARQYLSALGPELLASLGYDSTELEASLEAVHCSRKGLTVSWDRVFSSEPGFWNRLDLIAVEFLQQRQPRHSSVQLGKLFAGRL